jgi:hypothetical protein
MYMQALESTTKVDGITLDSEAMLDDFEYTLIKPYVKESEKDIKHKPYVGMDRISRLEYLQLLTSQSPSNSVDMYAEKYKNGELSIKQIQSILELGKDSQEHYIEIAGCVQAIEAVNKSRSSVWKVFHPFKNSAEKRVFAQMKMAFIEHTQGGEEIYNKAAVAAYEPFDGYQIVNANLEERMIHAKEEMNRKQKLNDVIRESLHIKEFETKPEKELSPKVREHNIYKREKQI